MQLYSQPTLLHDLVNKVNTSPEKEYSLITFSEEHPEINDMINSVYASRISNFSEYGSNWKNYIAQNYHYDQDYIPVVAFLNRGEVNVANDVYVGASYEINEEKFPTFDDNVPMWTTSANLNEITTVNEEQSVAIDNPIITIVNKKAPMVDDENGGGGGGGGGGVSDNTLDTEDQDESTPVNASANKCAITTHTHEAVNLNTILLTERFESSGRSDFNFVWVANAKYKASDNTWFTTNTSPAGARHQWKVHKNDINTLITINKTFFQPDMFNAPYCFEITNQPLVYINYFGVGFYERDWNRSRHKVLKYNKTSGTYTIRGRRKYASDVYFIDYSNNDSYPFGTRHPNPHTTWQGVLNGTVQLHRWTL